LPTYILPGTESGQDTFIGVVAGKLYTLMNLYGSKFVGL